MIRPLTCDRSVNHKEIRIIAKGVQLLGDWLLLLRCMFQLIILFDMAEKAYEILEDFMLLRNRLDVEKKHHEISM